MLDALIIFFTAFFAEIFLLLIYLADRRRQVVLKAQRGGTSLRQDASSSVSAQRGSIFVDHHLLVGTPQRSLIRATNFFHAKAVNIPCL